MITDTEMQIEALKLEKMRLDLVRTMMGYPTDPRARWTTLVDTKVAAGLSRVEAIKAAAKEQPELYAEQSVPKSEYRVS